MTYIVSSGALNSTHSLTPQTYNPGYVPASALIIIIIILQREDWQSAKAMSSSLVEDPTVRPPGFNLPQ